MNHYNPDIHHRRSIRLREYDYSRAGAYFFTICTHERICLFGEILEGTMALNSYGTMVERVWSDVPNHYAHVALDQFIIMPNHVHGIVFLIDEGPVGAGFKPAHGCKPASGAESTQDLQPGPTKCGTPMKRHGLSEIVRALKTFSARHINEARKSPGTPVWQRNYYEHVIRNEADYDRIAEYVATNPQRWNDDTLHPANFLVGGKGKMEGGGEIAGVDSKQRAGLKPAPTDTPQPGGNDE